jgi:hypothetical protein
VAINAAPSAAEAKYIALRFIAFLLIWGRLSWSGYCADLHPKQLCFTAALTIWGETPSAETRSISFAYKIYRFTRGAYGRLFAWHQLAAEVRGQAKPAQGSQRASNPYGLE